jgi:hypothetical protein
MHDETPDTSHIRNLDVTHETSDVNVGAIVKFVVWLCVAAIAIHLLMNGLFEFYAANAAKLDPAAPKIARSKAEMLPPEPRLQLAPGHPMHPLAEGENFMREQKAALENYSWIDQQRGIVHIPIEQAKQLVLSKNIFGVPIDSQRDPGLSAPSSSSSGSKLEWRDR